jgi:SAM-dependent methyltransferase
MLPEFVKVPLRRIYYGPPPAAPQPQPIDPRLFPQIDTPRPGELLPPPDMQAHVGGSFRSGGAEFLGYLDRLCGLKPDDHVLDVGSGCGRIALPLTTRLVAGGRYEGFDVWQPGVDWCREHITPAFPNFRFSVMDVRNAFYHPTGRYAPSEFIFPWDDATFDLVILTSIFTHLQPDDMEQYASEIARVMKPGARSLITYFLVNDESRPLIDAGKGLYNFPDRLPRGRTLNRARPEEAIAFDESDIRDVYRRNGLQIVEPIHHGWWCGREGGTSLQDIVIARKP